MTVGKAGLLMAGFVAMFAVGVMTGPTIRDNWSRMNAPQAPMDAPQAPVAAPSVEKSAPAPAKPDRPAARTRSSSSRTDEPVATKKPSNAIQRIEVSMWEPELRDRVKAVLNPGSRLEIAAADFDSSEQFVTTAYAARNTKVPFVVLKDRVLNKGQSLAEAIREFKPELDVKAEVQRARAAARSDLDIAG
jgi:hypothetical protein